MGFLHETDYLDDEVAYILGMILMRGTFVDRGSGGILTIRFPTRLDTISPPPGYELDIDRKTALQLALHRLRGLMEDVLGVKVGVSGDPGEAVIRAEFLSNTIAWRDLRMLCGDELSYERFVLPDVIFHAPRDIQLALVRGIADCSADPSEKDNAWGTSQRVVLQFQYSNWKLPLQVCALLQQELGIKVQHILWGHPNIRSPGGGHSWAKEHRMRIYAEEFCPVGFAFEYKQKVFEALADWNEKNPVARRQFCNPKMKAAPKAKGEHPDEHSDALPPEVRGHFDGAFEVCRALGCEQGCKSQEELFEEDEE